MDVLLGPADLDGELDPHPRPSCPVPDPTTDDQLSMVSAMTRVARRGAVGVGVERTVLVEPADHAPGVPGPGSRMGGGHVAESQPARTPGPRRWRPGPRPGHR